MMTKSRLTQVQGPRSPSAVQNQAQQVSQENSRATTPLPTLKEPLPAIKEPEAEASDLPLVPHDSDSMAKVLTARRPPMTRAPASDALLPPRLTASHRSKSDSLDPTFHQPRKPDEAGLAYLQSFSWFTEPKPTHEVEFYETMAAHLITIAAEHPEGLKVVYAEGFEAVDPNSGHIHYSADPGDDKAAQQTIHFCAAHDVLTDAASPADHTGLATAAARAVKRTPGQELLGIDLFKTAMRQRHAATIGGTRLHVTSDADGSVSNIRVAASGHFGNPGSEAVQNKVALFYANVLRAGAGTLRLAPGQERLVTLERSGKTLGIRPESEAAVDRTEFLIDCLEDLLPAPCVAEAPNTSATSAEATGSRPGMPVHRLPLFVLGLRLPNLGPPRLTIGPDNPRRLRSHSIAAPENLPPDF